MVKCPPYKWESADRNRHWVPNQVGSEANVEDLHCFWWLDLRIPTHSADTKCTKCDRPERRSPINFGDKTQMETEIEKAIKALMEKSKYTCSSVEAMQFAQAALNLAHVHLILAKKIKEGAA